MHATTKYINGHSGIVGGVVLTADLKLLQRLKHIQNSIGGVLSPFDSYMALRSVKTLGIRMERCEKNAMIIAEYLENTTKFRGCFTQDCQATPNMTLPVSK